MAVSFLEDMAFIRCKGGSSISGNGFICIRYGGRFADYNSIFLNIPFIGYFKKRGSGGGGGSSEPPEPPLDPPLR